MPDPAPDDRVDEGAAGTPTPTGSYHGNLVPELKAEGDQPERTRPTPPGGNKGGLLPSPAAPVALMQFGKYRVLGKIDSGGMGTVFEAEDPDLKRRVALKVMNPDLAIDPAARERFIREARAAAAVRHDNIIIIHDVGEQNGQLYLVMELLAGESLATRLMHGPLPPDEVIRIGREVAAGLAAARATGIVHRDIKPSNLWLEAPTDRVKILDFGLAHFVSGVPGLTGVGEVMGTPDYMSPEQAVGLGVDHRSDLFSLGAVLYLAVSEVKPFPGRNVEAVRQAVIACKPQKASDVNPVVPEALADFIHQLLTKEPADRPQTAEEVIEALDAIAAGRSPPRPEDRGPRRNRWRWVALAAVAVAVAGALGIALWSWFGKDPPVDYQGRVDVLVNRKSRWVPLIEVDALPVKNGDSIKIQVEVKPAAYLYVFWVDPDGETFPIYPWNGGWGTRPAKETPVSALNIPDTGDYTIDPKKPTVGVTTMVAFASPKRLKQTDADFQAWFHDLPRIERAKKDTRATVWFDNYAPPRSGQHLGPVAIESIDPYERWQIALKKRVGGAAPFETSMSFAQDMGK